ncbi:MAG: PLDc N-terminal domain-containing protein [Propionicimonas sp.]
MGRVLPVVIIAMLMIYAVVEVAQADPLRVRLMPRWLWAVAIILLPGAGALAWLLLGRPTKAGNKPPRPPRAPDDDPDFLRNL